MALSFNICTAFDTILILLVPCFLIFRIIDYFLRKPMLTGLPDKYIFVTGCDTGFGWYLARRLDGLGVRVFAGCYTQAGQEELSQQCSDRLVTVPLDVTKDESIEKAYSIVKKQIPAGQGLWGIVNNAGITGGLGPSAWLKRKDYQRVLDVNTLGMIAVNSTFLPLVKKAGGRIVNMASVLGHLGVPASSPYSMSKYAVIGYSDSLRREMQVFGVSVHTIKPGGHKTNLTERETVIRGTHAVWDQMSDELKEEYGEEYRDTMLKTGLTSLEWTVTGTPHAVVDAYIHALFARFPRTQYSIGWDTYIYTTLAYLPDCLSDIPFRLLPLVPACLKR